MAVKRKVGRPKGGSTMKNVERALRAKTKVNKDKKITKITIDDEETQYRCVCCGKYYKMQRNNFIVSRSPLFKGNNGYVPICKVCMDQYYEQLVEFFDDNETKAIERCCQLFDWYFSTDAVAQTLKTPASGKTRVTLYPSRLNILPNKGLSYLDTIAERVNDGEIITDIDDIGEEGVEISDEETGENITIDKKTIIFWGAGYKPSEYSYLQEQYDEWTTRYEAETKAQEELFKNLCISQLSIQQAKQKGTIKDFSDATKTFQDLLGSANLKPNQNNSNDLVERNCFGTLIKRWEDEKPIPEPEDEFKDVDNIKKYINTFFAGQLAEMLKIDNPNSQAYREEIGKYTVKKPEYEGDDVGFDNGNNDVERNANEE